MAPTIITTTLVPAAKPSTGQLYDLVDLVTAKAVLNILTGASDVYLALVITQVSSAIRRYCNRVFQVQDYQDRFWPERGAYPWQVTPGVEPLQLVNWPLSAVPSTAGTAPPLQPVLSASGGGSLAAATYYVRATYVTPYGETAASLEQVQMLAADQLLGVASPGGDTAGIATGWNVYVSTVSGLEQKQNASPIAISSGWTLPVTGLLPSGAALPNYILAIENAQLGQLSNAQNIVIGVIPSMLTEGVDFIADAEKGQLTRLFIDGMPRTWPALPLLIQYPAGFAAIPADVQDAALRLIKGQYFGQMRDPRLRQENVEGVYSATYWFANGPGEGNFPPDVENLLDMHRVPVIA